MGYFSEDEQKQQVEQRMKELEERLKREEEERQSRLSNKNKKGGSKFGYFISGLSGIIVGALLIWLLLPSLANQLPGSNNTNSTENNTTTTQTATDVESDVVSAVDKVSSAVVGITNIQEATQNFWSQSTDTLQEVGSGSGVIYKIDGDRAFIVTNHHVIEGAKQLEVTLADGTKVEAQLAGSDVWTDLAVISIPSEGVNTVAQFGDSDALKQGETVIAIGNPLGLDFYGSVTKGIISGKDRSIPVDLNEDGVEDWTTDVLQTDAAINAGNSGGALVNITGDLIGINSMKIAQSSVEGLGFAIPINSAIPVIEELEQKGEVERPTMGVSLVDLTDVPAYYQQQFQVPEEVTNGVVITQVVANSAAAKAGAKQYDVIVEMDGQKIENAIDLRKHLYNEKEIGDTLTMKVYRQGQLVELNLELTDNTQL